MKKVLGNRMHPKNELVMMMTTAPASSQIVLGMAHGTAMDAVRIEETKVEFLCLLVCDAKKCFFARPVTVTKCTFADGWLLGRGN